MVKYYIVDHPRSPEFSSYKANEDEELLIGYITGWDEDLPKRNLIISLLSKLKIGYAQSIFGVRVIAVYLLK